MSEKIEPALTPEDWRGYSHAFPQKHFGHTTLDLTAGEIWIDCLAGGNRAAPETAMLQHVRLKSEIMPALIAMANAALPADDPRKITREKIAALQDAAEVLNDEYSFDPKRVAVARLAMQFAQALEAYLPPDAT